MKRSLLLIVMFVCAAFSAGAAGRESVKTVLFPFREAVISAQAESTLQPYRFKLGEPFKEGAVLVTLDDSRYALEEQRAAGQFEFARATYEDKKQLLSGKIPEKRAARPERAAPLPFPPRRSPEFFRRRICLAAHARRRALNSVCVCFRCPLSYAGGQRAKTVNFFSKKGVLKAFFACFFRRVRIQYIP